MQFTALGLIEIETREHGQIRWTPTEKGMSKLFALGALTKEETRAREIEDFDGQQGEPVSELPEEPSPS